MKKLIAFFIVAITLTACETTQAPRYTASSDNTISLMDLSAKGERASVASVSISPGIDAKPLCRLMGELDIAAGKTTQEAIKEALQAELLAGKIYSKSGTALIVEITRMDVSTINGTWDLAAKISSNKKPAGFTVNNRFDYKTSFSAYKACDNATIAFNGALSQLFNKAFNHPRFAEAI